MCGRYVLWGIDLLGQRFLIIDPPLGFRSHFNIVPATENPVIVHAAGGNRVVAMRWGLVPNDPADPRSAPKPINARAETLSEKRLFRRLLDTNRCIVPANGFYE
jgi:putative SOS response-associated peptidase YedK